MLNLYEIASLFLTIRAEKRFCKVLKNIVVFFVVVVKVWVISTRLPQCVWRHLLFREKLTLKQSKYYTVIPLWLNLSAAYNWWEDCNAYKNTQISFSSSFYSSLWSKYPEHAQSQQFWS